MKVPPEVKKVAEKLAKTVHLIFIIYSIKRFNKIPQKYNKIFYVLLVSPWMLVSALWYPDLIAYRYRKFLIGFTYPKIRLDLDTSYVYRDCPSHKKLAGTPQEASCVTLFNEELIITLRRVFRLYTRFYLFQLVLRVLISRTFTLQSLQNAIVNILKSSLFLGGQTIFMRVLLCVADHFEIKLNPVRLFFLSIINSVPIYAERSDRVGQINSFVLAHICVGFLKKMNALPYFSLPIMCAAVAKDKGKVKPVNLLIAAASTIVF